MVSEAPIESLTITETEALVEVYPAGFHRLPSVMRPPVRRGHMRSASAGGNVLTSIFMQTNPASTAPLEATTAAVGSTNTTKPTSATAAAGATASIVAAASQSSKPLPSVLKRTAPHQQHRR